MRTIRIFFNDGTSINLSNGAYDVGMDGEWLTVWQRGTKVVILPSYSVKYIDYR